jgi:chitin disaccharide deacetylase
VQIIVNADDFGESKDTLAATLKCFEAGHLTSASIMVSASHSADALQYALAHPEFSYGVHLQFVGDGEERPISDPSSVSGLVDREGRFLPTNLVRRRALLGQVPIAEIEREAARQIEIVQQEGITVSHVDSHRHLHKFTPFRIALQNTLPRLGITRVRNVQNTYLRHPIEHPTFWFGPAWRRQLMRAFRTTDRFYMPTTAHDPSWYRLADALPACRTLEVGLHPGYEDEWRRAEWNALRTFVENVRAQGHELVGWDAI